MTSTTLIVTFRREGWHEWPEAPAARGYLAARHRHLFHFKCEIKLGVDARDREVEFHDILAHCQNIAPGDSWGTKSCEAVATAMATRLAEEYDCAVAVEVWEDGECGARVEVS